MHNWPPFVSRVLFFESFENIYIYRERESLLAQTFNNFVQIKVKALGQRKKLSNRLSRRAPLNSFINFYRGLK